MSIPVALSPVGNGYQFTGLSGQVLAGGFLYVYEAGTSIPEPTYTDNPGTVLNTNPIVLDASGHAPHEVWLENGIAYKFVSTDSSDNVQYTWDNIVGINDPLLGPSYASGPVTEATASGGQTVFSTFNYTPGFHGIMVFKNGINLNSTQYTESSGNTITLASPASGGDVIRVVGIVIGTPGEDGTQGPIGPTGANGLTWRGQWGALTIYQANDGVFNAGSSYIALGASLGIPPPNVTYWDIIAEVGGTILPSGMVTIPETVFTATAGQTVFDLTFSYVVGENTILVFLNGSKLSLPAYTESSSTQITLAVPARVNDELVVIGQATGFTGATGATGQTGATGATGAAATIAAGTTTTSAPGSSASVNNSGSSSAAVFDFTIPRGDVGAIGMVWTGDWNSGTNYGATDGVYIAGSSYICTSPNINIPPPNAAYWSLVALVGGTILPSGLTAIPETVFTATAGQTIFDLSFSYVVGGNTVLVFLNGSKLSIPAYTETSTTQITLAIGANSGDEVVVVGQATGFTGPTGATGAAATVTAGSTTTGAPGSSASVVNSGSTSAAVFDFTIPRGDVGATGSAATITVGTVTTGAPGSSATVVNSGSSSAATFDFTIPQGDPGTILSVTGTAPVSVTAGVNPVVSMAAATTLVPGYLSNTDWNTFNGKVDGPAGATSGNVATFNGATGKLIQDGGALGTAAFTSSTAYDASGTATSAVSAHAALTTGVHGLAITAGQTLTVTSGGTIGSAAYTASTAYATALQGTNADNLRLDIGRYGFLNQTQTTISFNDAGNLFTLTDAGGGWSYYRSGIRYNITGNKTVSVPAATGTTTLYFIFIDATDGTLSVSTSAWTLNDTKVPVATVCRNSTLTPTYLMGEERHTCLIDRRIHMEMHYTQGTEYTSGGALTGPTVGSNVNANKTCAVTAANFFDEDIYEATQAITAGNGSTDAFYTILYRTTASTWAWQRSIMPFRYTGAAAIQFDNAGTMTAATTGANRYVNYYLCVCNMNGQESILWIPGQAQFTSLALAQAEDFGKFTLTGIPIIELVAIYQFNWQVNGSNLGLCALGVAPVRVSKNIIASNGITVTAHNSLGGLQGGTVNEYFHLTNLEYSELTTGYQAIVTAAGTTTLTASSPYRNDFTGTNTQTVVLPDATTLVLGNRYLVDDNSTGAVTVQTNGGATLWVVASGCTAILTVTNIGSAAGSWDVQYEGAQVATGKKLSVSNSVTLAGTDGTTLTMPTTTSTLSRSPTITRITATAGQTAFTVGTYQTGNNSMLVFVNGALLILTDDYAETNTTTITISAGLKLNDRFVSLSF